MTAQSDFVIQALNLSCRILEFTPAQAGGIWNTKTNTI